MGGYATRSPAPAGELLAVGLVLLSATALVLSPVQAAASEEEAPPARAAARSIPAQSRDEYIFEPPRSFVTPAIEIPVLHAGILAFDKYIIGADWAQVTTTTIERNLGGGWTIDPDDLWVNYLGHPFHGSLYFNAARSSGLTFVESLPFTFAGSLLWEIAGEAQPPSTNDLITTGFAGSLFGEMFHRLSQLLVGGQQPPSALEKMGAFLMNPVGTMNGRILGRPRPRRDLPALPPFEGRWLFGGYLLGARNDPEVTGELDGVRLQTSVGVEVSYGFPGEQTMSLWGPLAHFDLRADAGFVGSRTANASIRGLLVGPGFGEADTLAGAWGLFGLYNYLSAPAFRLADTGLGPGVAVQKWLGTDTRLRASAVAGPMFAGVGTRKETDELLAFGATTGLYPTGPGFEEQVDVELAHGNLGALRLSGYGWQLQAKGDRWERVGALTLGARVPLFGHQQLGGDLSLTQRSSDNRQGLVQQGLVARVTWAIAFGLSDVMRPPPGPTH